MRFGIIVRDGGRLLAFGMSVWYVVFVAMRPLLVVLSVAVANDFDPINKLYGATTVRYALAKAIECQVGFSRCAAALLDIAARYVFSEN